MKQAVSREVAIEISMKYMKIAGSILWFVFIFFLLTTIIESIMHYFSG